MESSNDLLSSLLSDPTKLQKLLSMANTMMGDSKSVPTAPPSAAHPSPHIDNLPPIAPMSKPAAFSAPANTYDPSAELMAKALPVIREIAQSGSGSINREKSNLLQAIKPFVTSDISGQFDHAVRLVSMARMARTALHQFSPTKETALVSHQSKPSEGVL